ncbi:MAG: RluA family pseudouridine synthase [Spirochaetales bacterium]|nr:RluA family pseudouridine synthase [Spirochaetales bacterium]
MNSKHPFADGDRPRFDQSESKWRGFPVGSDDEGRRLDVVVRKLLSDLPLARLLKAIRQGDVRVNGRKATPERRLIAGEELSVWAPLVQQKAPTNVSPRALPPEFFSWVLKESPDLLVFNKPSGLLVHPGDQRGQRTPPTELTLAEAVKLWWQGRFASSLSFQPGPLHRLDRNTSGILVFSLTLRGARQFSEWMAQHLVQKTYFTLLSGEMRQETLCTLPLVRQDQERSTRIADAQLGEAGLTAQTRFIPLTQHRGLTLAKVRIDGGRTHQIRAHAAALGYPLRGDTKYGAPQAGPWWLHAYSLTLPDDRLGWQSLQAPFPEFWQTEPWVKNFLK